MGRKKNETFTANDVKKIWSKHYSTGDNKSVTKPETKTETKTSTYTQTEAPKNETFTANDVKKIWNANSGSNTNNDSKVSTPKQTVNNTQKYTGGRKTTATITPTRNRLENDILANISRNSTPSYEGYTQSNVKTTKHGSLDTKKTDKADSKKKSKETEDESPFNKAFNLPDLTVQQFKEEYDKNPSAFKFKSHIDEDTLKKAAEGDEEARKKAIKEEYESIPERNFFERAANRFTRENATLYGLFPQNLPEDYPNYREDYNRKQELSKEYKKIKYDEAVSDLLGSGFTEEDLKSLNKRVLTQKDIDRLVAEGKTDEEIDRIAEELFEKGENTSRRLYDYTTDKKKNPAGLSFDDYMDAIVEYYTKPALKELAKEKPVMASIDTLFTNPFESIYNVGANGWNYLAGRPLENNPTTADIMREGVNERIGNKLGQIAYGGVMSIGDMAVAQGIDFALGGGGVISAGLQAAEKASQVSNDAVERGLTPNRIFASTIASGVTTFVTEKISMGRLSDIAEHGLTNYSAKEIAKTLGASFVTEGAQEGMEDVADWITGSLISWDKNEFNQAYQAYLESGESKEEAVGHVISDKLVELISDIVMGGIGGGVMGGVNTGLAYAAGKIQTNPHVDTDTVLESDTALNQLIEAVQTIDTTNLSEEFAQRVEHAQEVAQKPSDELTVEDVVDMANAVNEQAGPDNNLAQTIQEINYQANYERNINEYIETGKIEEKENELPIEKAAREQAQLAVKDYTKAALEQQKQAEKDFINNLKSYKKNDWQSDAEVKANTEQRLQEASAYFENETAAKNYIDNYNGQDLSLYTEVSYLAYTAGESGQSFDTFLKNSVEADLMIKHGGVDKGYLKTLFYNGQNARTTDNEVVTLRKNENRGLATNLSPEDELAVFKKAIAKRLNIEVETNFEDAESRGSFVAEIAKLVTNSTSDNEYATIIHEMFEFARSYNAKGMEIVDRMLTDMIVKKKGERSFVDAVNRYKEAYRSAGKNAPEGSSLKAEANKTLSEAQEEFVNDAISYIFSTEEGIKNLTDYIMDDGSTTAQEKMSAIQTIKAWVDNLITAIKNFLSGHKTDQLGYKYAERLKLSSEELEGISRKLVAVLDEARANLAAMTEQGEANNKQEVGESEKVAHQVKVPANETLEDKIKRESDNFEKQLDAWDGVDERKHFVVGTTSEILNKEIGVPNAEIKMDSSKIVKVFKDHPEMKKLLHRIPEILNDPIIIMESRTVADAYVLYGNVFSGKDPVMVSLLIYPKGRNGIALDIHKVSSAYAKDNAQYQLNHSVVKYISPDKKRTAAWNRLTRLQLPFAPTISSSTNNVPQNQPNSKTQSGKTRNSLAVTEDSEGRELSEGQQEYFKDSVVRDDQGRLMVMYHGTPNGDFTVFRGGSYFTNMAWYADRYQNQGASSLGYKKTAKNPKTYAAYLNITKPFDTRDPEIRKIWDEQYYQKWDTGDITENGLPDWTAAEGLREFIEENGLNFDGLIIDEGGVPTDDGVLSRGFAWIPLNGGNQVKDINNLNPTPNKDMRFSIDVSSDDFFDSFLEIDDEVKKTESALKEMIDKKMDLDSDISKKMISDVASYIKNKYNSTYKKDWLESSITAIFKFLQNNNVRMEDIMYIMSDIAKPVLEQTKATDPEQEKLYKDIVNTVKSYKIKLDAGQKQEVINAYGSYKNFVDSMRGKITLSNDGIALDNIWTELVDKTGGSLSYGTVPNDQPIELANFINGLNPTYAALEGQALEDAAMDVALDIISQFYVHNSMTEAVKAVKGELTKRANKFKEDYKKRYNEALKQVEAEKALNIKRLADEIDNLTAEEQEAIRTGDTVNQVLIENLKKEYKARYERLQAQANEKIARARANYQNSWINKNLRRERSELKNRVLREVKALQNMIAHPQEGASKHVPINLIKPTIEMLEAINLDNGGRNKAIAERLKKMSEVYESFKNDDTYSFDYDERIASDIKELQEMFNNKSYADLGITELQRVIEIVTALKTQIKNANNLILQGKLQDAKAAADNAINEVKGSRRLDNAAMNALNKYGNIHLNAYREFRKLSGYQDGALMDIYNDLDEGSKREMQIQKDLGAIFQDVLEGQKNQKEVKKFISTKEEDLVDIGITDKNGKPIKITRAMRMSLIMHSMNAGNMRHVLGSGITIPNMYYFSKGKLDEAYAKGTNYRFVDYAQLLEAIQRNDQNKINELTTKAQERIEDMKKDLSDWEKNFLKDAEKMFHDETGKLINETSMKLKGYALARVKNYFPIKTDRHFTSQDWTGLIQNGSLEGSGSLKERVISTKPILLEDITNVIQRQIRFTSKYAGLAVAVRNFETIMKQTSRDDNGQLHNLYETIDKVWGSSDTNWLRNLMQDIQGGRKESDSALANFFTKLRGNFAAATLNMNLGVAIKQAASYPTAAAVTGWKPLLRNIPNLVNGFRGKGIAELEAINPLLWYREQGYGTQDLADAKSSDIMKKLPPNVQKALGWTQMFDTATVRTLEYVAKDYVDHNYKDLKKGTGVYWNKVSDVFTRIVEETQPNYSKLQQADIIRNPNALNKMLVMFKTQPMQNFGIIYDAMGELNAAVQSGNQKWTKEATSKAANAITSQIVSASVFSVMTMIGNILKHRTDRYKDEDDEWSIEKILQEFGISFASCLVGGFIGGSVIYEGVKFVLEKFVQKKGARYYGLEVSAVEVVNDIVTNAGKVATAASSVINDKTSAGKENAAKKSLDALLTFGETVGEYIGVPVRNMKQLMLSMAYYSIDAVEGIKNGDFKVSGDRDIFDNWEIPTQYERIYEAMMNGDTDEAERLTQQLVKQMMKEKKEELKSGEVTEDAIIEAVKNDIVEKYKDIVKEDFMEGDISAEEAERFLVEEIGKTENDAFFQVRKWDTGENKYDIMKDNISKAAEDPTPENRKAINEEIKILLDHGVDKGTISSEITKAFKSEYIDLYNKNKAADLNSILRSALVAAGYTDEDAKKKIEKWIEK